MPENDGWGHALESTTIADDLKELKGYLDGKDKHEQAMQEFTEVVNSEEHEQLLKKWQEQRNSTNQSNNQ
jgi:predicted component of type VI protein secretion system